ncbi:DinB family protein [Reichenbachiella carrageenanivorans]|uniref:DinB family protein n=1 Tax=Reichenbachiella carrageenanivorans TaxID=2979869 RepID=A0ABY6CXT1_9BACT|nr:DinB family protein [Reichenbachiella carrageenanivorans]UXX78731.1 DinB family protein [Reichenbachiella carrageenanivorans]
MKIEKPLASEYDPFYAGYIQSVAEWDVMEMIKDQKVNFTKFIHDLPPDKHDYAYEEGKWSIRQVVRHLIDAERIFGYRAMTIARGDRVRLPGF